MSLEILLGAALEAGLGLIAEVGFREAAQGLKDQVTQADRQKLRGLVNTAARQADVADLRPLLEHAPFQEEVVSALLDPTLEFDLAAVAATFGDRLPAQRADLRRFFEILENVLTQDATWGPILERYSVLRQRRDVQRALQAQNLGGPTRSLVQELNARLAGSGGLAQGDRAVAAGAHGVAVSGNVHKIVQVYVRELVVARSTPPPPVSLRQRYLEEVAREANLLPWNVLNQAYADPAQGKALSLADVYTGLDTTALRHMEREEDLRQFLARHDLERVSAQEMANRHTRLLLMGDPGSGKSTFTRYLAYTLAQAGRSDDPAGRLALLTKWNQGALLPLRIELRDVAVFAGRRRGDTWLLLDYLQNLMQRWKLEGFWPELDAALRSDSQPVMILLDGLDEVPTIQRQQIVDMVNDMAKRYDWHRYLVTCRPYAYVGQPWLLDRFQEATLAPFSITQIDRFVNNWYEQLSRFDRFSQEEARLRASRLHAAVQRRDLIGLAERPLLLTVMTQLHTFRGMLPDDRTQLYADSVDLLLERWENRDGQEPGILAALNIPNLKMSDLKAGLYDVAFQAHSRYTGERTADITEAQLREWLSPYLAGDWNKAGTFIGYIRERAGLLVRHKTEAFTFPHRTFQEFLAACYLNGQRNYPSLATDLVKSDPDHWREVYLLAAGHAARSNFLDQALAAVDCLCLRSVADTHNPTTWHWTAAQLAGLTLPEIGLVGVQRKEKGQELQSRVQGWLKAAIRRNEVPVHSRVTAGRVLAGLSDDRPEAISIHGMQFCYVPAGRFWMGSGDTEGLANEKPRHLLELSSYWIGRFPVTNAQYTSFVQARGYAAALFWPEAKAAGYWTSTGTFYDRRGPARFSDPFGLPNHPVVGVSWYEALAFCRWLSEKLNREVRLPSESEWEKAARGGEEIPVGVMIGAAGDNLRSRDFTRQPNPDPLRDYPWEGTRIVPELANYDETGIGSTSAVGCYAAGASPYGVEEMAGNVWEWTRSLWGNDLSKPTFAYPYVARDGREGLNANTRRVLRGGSWLNPADLVRSTYRLHRVPRVRGYDIGFRVIIPDP